MPTQPPPLNLAAWHEEPEPADESRFTKLARPGWSSWNNMSPEVEFCETAAQLVRLMRPLSIIETGVGQGFATRRVAAAMPDRARYRCFESFEPLRDEMAKLDFFAAGSPVSLATEPTPSPEDFAWAQFTMLDSGSDYRPDEMRGWWEHAAEGAYVMVHDTGSAHAEWTPHRRMAKLIGDLGVPGVFFKNPRGCFLGQKR